MFEVMEYWLCMQQTIKNEYAACQLEHQACKECELPSYKHHSQKFILLIYVQILMFVKLKFIYNGWI